MHFLRQYKDLFHLLLLLIIAFISVYSLPLFANKTLFLLTLPLVWNSKKDYLWFAFFIILLNEPGGFFSGGLREDAHRLPIYTMGTIVSITIVELYFITIFLKFIFKKKLKKKESKVFIKKELHILLALFLLLIVISFMLGTSLDGLRNMYKIALNLTLFYSIFYIISDRKDLIAFLNLLFPFVFVALILQVYGLIAGYQPIEILKPDSVRNLYGTVDSIERRPLEMVFLLFICFTGSLFFLSNIKSPFKKSFLILINGTSFLSIMLTGTRAWFFAFTIGYLYYFILMRKINILGMLPKIGATIIIIGSVTVFVPAINMQVQNAWNRLSTVQYLAEGDLSLGQTAGRYTDYAPILLEKFRNSTIIFGAAFSDYYYDNDNIHVGYHNHLFNVGLVGVVIFASIILRIIYISFFSVQRNTNTKLALLPLLLLLIINSGVQTIGYGVIHTTFFILQAYSLALLVIANNMGKNLI